MKWHLRNNHTDEIKHVDAVAFKHLILFSNGLDNDLARRDYLRLLGMRLQNELLLRPILRRYVNDEKSPDDPTYFMGDSANLIWDNINACKWDKYDGHWVASLSNNIILPWPWRSDRYIRALNTIGEGKKNGKWHEDIDHHNHFTKLYLPWGLIFVGNGNHSIAAGILAREGKVTIDIVYDVSRLYDLFHTDGRAFYSNDGNIVSKNCSLWFATIFEVAKSFSNKDPIYLWEYCWRS